MNILKTRKMPDLAAHGPRIIPILITIFIACFMDGLDGSILNSVLPSIAEAFDVSVSVVSWVPLAYLLTVAGTLLIFGKFASHGHLKELFIVGILLFILGSFICSLAYSLALVIAARVIQGLGGSMLLSCASVISVKYLPENVRGLAFGLITVATFVGIAIGPLLGGLISTALSWEWIFAINVPVGLIGLIYAIVSLPADTPEKREQFDGIGALLLFLSMLSGVFVLERLPKSGIDDPVFFTFLLVFAVSAVLFVIVSLKRKNPFFNLRIFKIKAVTAMILGSVILQVVFAGIIYLLPFFITNQYDADPVLRGVLLSIQPAVTALLGWVFGKWSDIRGRRVFCITGCVLLVALSGAFALLDGTYGLIPFIITLVTAGICFAMVSGPASGRIVDVTPKEEQETAATIAVTCMYLSSVVGTAVFSAIFTRITANNSGIFSFADLPGEVFRLGFAGSMIFGAVLAAAAVILYVVVKEKKPAAGKCPGKNNPGEKSGN